MNERQKTIALVGLVFLLLSCAYFLQGYKHHTTHIEEVVNVTEEKFNTVIDTIYDFSFSPYSQRVKNLLTTSPQLIVAFANRDRKLLYQKALPKFDALRSENPLFQVMHFHLPKGESFLRMHDPNIYGDDLTAIRPIVNIVHEEKIAHTGFEISMCGPLYRIVHPVFHQGGYIGAIELGIKVDQLLYIIKNKIEFPVTSFFQEDLLKKATYLQNSSWKSFGNFKLIVNDQEIFAELPDSLQLNDDDQRIVIRERTYTLHVHPQFTNFQGKPIGGIVVLQEITELLNQKASFFWKSSLFILVLFIFAFTTLYLGFGNIMRSLEQSIIRLTAAEKKAFRIRKEWERTVDATPDLISILDKKFDIIRTNKALPEMLGLSMQEVIGRQCHSLYCNTDEPPVNCPYHSLLQNKKTCRNEIFYENLGYYFDVILSPIFDDEGTFIGAVHVSRNITKRKLLEQKVEDSKQYLTAILEASTNTAIIATNTELQVKYCNKETEKLFGLPINKIIGRSVFEFHSNHNDRPMLHMQETMKQIRSHGYHQFFIQRNERLLDAQISTIDLHNSKNAGSMLLLARDITAQKEMERKLLHAEKHEAVSLLAAGVAHDLNNILSGVTGYSELMLLNLPQDSELSNSLSRILKSGRRAAAVVADLLTIARGIAKSKEAISLNDLILAYLDTPDYIKLNSEHPNIDIHLELAPDCWDCHCSSIHIAKILMNLIINAVEAVGINGKVDIITKNQDGRPIQAGDSTQGNKFVVLDVKDTGPGIPAESLQHIFEPYYSTKKMGRSGSGLGLAVVWNVVKEHGGLVTVNSNSNGTTFTVYLPACDETIIPNNKDDEAYSFENLKGSGVILIVDDDLELRNVGLRMLSTLGYTVHTVNSGEKAVSWLQKHTADLLVLDMDLGVGINGCQAYAKALELFPAQKAIITSGLAEETVMNEAIQLGINNFISKPYSFEKFGKAVQRAMIS